MIGTSGIVEGKAWIGIDGLIAIARVNGMLRYIVSIEEEACAVILSVGAVDYCYTYSMDDVRADGSGTLPVWREHFHQMFKSWSVGKAIRTHFKDAVEATEAQLLAVRGE